MNAIVPVRPSSVYSGAQLSLIRKTVAADCNEAEFDLFVTVARHTGLDPFRKQVSALVFNKKQPEKRRMAIVTTIDGLRVTAARSLRYRPDDDEPQFEYDPEEKSETNPLGLVKAKVKIFMRDEGGSEWRTVVGVSYWGEFAPITEEWAEDPETGKRRKTGRMMLDRSGNWFRMPRLMLAKTAEAQALRKAFPEDLSSLYEGSELDRARALDIEDLTPSQMIGEHNAATRLEKIGGANTVLFQFLPNEALESVPLGKLADRILATAEGFTSLAQARWFMEANTQPLREFWARAPGEALEVKKRLEVLAAKLQQAEAEATKEAEEAA
jgi:phage recombination protein Bet